jgi:hypothetical protein
MTGLLLVVLTLSSAATIDVWTLCIVAAWPRVTGTSHNSLTARGTQLGRILHSYVPAMVMAFAVLVNIQTGWHWPLAGLLAPVLALWVFAHITRVFEVHSVEDGEQGSHSKTKTSEQATAPHRAERHRSIRTDDPNR